VEKLTPLLHFMELARCSFWSYVTNSAFYRCSFWSYGGNFLQVIDAVSRVLYISTMYLLNLPVKQTGNRIKNYE
jgi:hypothetical protein